MFLLIYCFYTSIDLVVNFDGCWDPRWTQKGAKNYQSTIRKKSWIFQLIGSPFWHHFGLHVGSQDGPKTGPKGLQKLLQKMTLQKVMQLCEGIAENCNKPSSGPSKTKKLTLPIHCIKALDTPLRAFGRHGGGYSVSDFYIFL